MTDAGTLFSYDVGDFDVPQTLWRFFERYKQERPTFLGLMREKAELFELAKPAPYREITRNSEVGRSGQVDP